MTRIEVGVVAAIYRYPVKSMRGEAVEESHVFWPGLDGDRRYAFVRSGNLSSFPWLTGRDVPALIRYAPYFVDPGRVIESAVRVRTPAGGDLALESAELRAELAALYDGPVHLMKSGRGTHDSLPLSLISEATLGALDQMLGGLADVRRFRPNLLVRTHDGRPFAEESWLGARVVLGGADAAWARINDRIDRCAMINIDPDTAARNPAVLRTVVGTREKCVAVWASTERPGWVRVGDPIWLETDAGQESGAAVSPA